MPTAWHEEEDKRIRKVDSGISCKMHAAQEKATHVGLGWYFRLRVQGLGFRAEGLGFRADGI